GGARFRHLSALTQQERDPEVRLSDEPLVTAFGAGKRLLEALELRAGGDVCPARLRSPYRGAESQIDLRAVGQAGGPAEKAERLPVGKTLQRMVPRDDE